MDKDPNKQNKISKTVHAAGATALGLALALGTAKNISPDVAPLPGSEQYEYTHPLDPTLGFEVQNTDGFKVPDGYTPPVGESISQTPGDPTHVEVQFGQTEDGVTPPTEIVVQHPNDSPPA